LAQALIERGQRDQARPYLLRLLDAFPGHPAARLEMARIELAEGDLDKASQSLVVCLTNAYTARPAKLLLAQIEQRQGKSESAAALATQAMGMPRPFDWPDPYLREVLRLRVDRQQVQDRINGWLASGQLPDAEAGLQQLMGAYPDDPEGLLLLGRLRLLERQCEDAEEILRRHLSIQPASLNGLIQLALSVLCQQRWHDGAAILRQTIAIKPDFAEAHYNLGYARARAGDLPGARQSYVVALRCRPGYVDAHVALAEILLRAGDPAAGSHLNSALELDPGNDNARRLRDLLPNPR
jgi:tetratricopeptide (TPR) repeat protein